MIPDKIIEGLSDEWVVRKSDENTISNGPRIIQISQNTVTPLIFNGNDDVKEGTLDEDHLTAVEFCISVLEEVYSGDNALIVIPETLSPVDFEKHPGTEAILFDLQHTAPQFLKQHPGRGGVDVVYVEGHYVTIALNYAFKFRWSFEHISTEVYGEEVVVYGELTAKFADGTSELKSQAGSANIKFFKQSADDVKNSVPKIPISVGDAIKAAITDCKKKCASEFGIAWDVYSGAVKPVK